ncbi:MAG: hypothetical protein HZA54_10835 [Planctomycetes bacterium]|nr:hypothetical protein [Planctomycetota bacterium]
MRKNRGMVLIVAMGMLGILSVLAIVFMTITGAERSVTQSYVDDRRAYMLATSGLERAAGELANSILAPAAAASQFSASEGEEKPWVFGKLGTVGSGPISDPGIPLAEAIYVSYQAVDAAGTPDFVRIASRQNTPKRQALFGEPRTDIFGVTGRLGATYGGGADYYAIKILDAGGRIWINGPDLNDGNANPNVAKSIADLAPNVRMMLNTLGQILATEQQFSVPNLGDVLSTFRKQLGRDFDMLTEIKPVLGSSDQAQTRNFELLRAYVTSKAWVDRSTLDPRVILHPRPDDPNIIYNNSVAFTRADGSPQEELAMAPRIALPAPFTGTLALVWASCGSDRLVGDDPGKWAPHWVSRSDVKETPAGAEQIGPVLQPRAPVNVNSAAREVLRALLTNLRGRYFLRTAGSPTEPRTFMGNGFKPGFEVTIDATLAGKLADKLIEQRRALITARGYGFATWHDFNTYVDSLPDSFFDGDKRKARAKKNVVKANANPNSHLNKFNPDLAFGTSYGETDKGDLVYVPNGNVGWTTEFGFASNGYFEIESLGRVLGAAGAGEPARVIAEKKISTMVKVSEVFRHSTQREFVVNRVGGGSGTATTYTLYPENLDDVGLANAAEYDGYLMPATTDKGAGLAGAAFRATYTKDFGLDAVGPAEHGVSLINPASGGSPSGSGNGASELFNDGLFVHESRRYPSYTNVSQYGSTGFGAQDDYVRNERADAKIKMDNGTLEMWVKPTWAASEFPSLLQGTINNPVAIGSRTFFSAGDGKLGAAYGNTLGPSDQTVSDNRVAVFARHGTTGPFLFGLQATRIAEPYGWQGTSTKGPYPMADLFYYWGWYHANWYRMPNNLSSPQDPYNWAFPGVWHHVRFVWNAANSAYLFVDGRPSGDDPVLGGRAEQAMAASAWSLFPGTNRFRTNSTNGYVCSGDVTIDDLKLYKTQISTTSFVPPHRYVNTCAYSAKIGPPATSALDPLDKTMDFGGRVASVSWTAHYPKFTGSGGSTSWNFAVVGAAAASSALAVNVTPGQAQELEGRGARPTAPINFAPGDELRYAMQMNVTSASYRMAAPIFDDVTVTVIPAGGFKYLYYTLE